MKKQKLLQLSIFYFGVFFGTILMKYDIKITLVIFSILAILSIIYYFTEAKNLPKSNNIDTGTNSKNTKTIIFSLVAISLVLTILGIKFIASN